MQSPLLVPLVNVEVEKEFWFRLIMISKKGLFFLISVSKVNISIEFRSKERSIIIIIIVIIINNNNKEIVN